MVKVQKEDRVQFLKKFGKQTIIEFLRKKLMGSLTNLKENKTIFIPSGCKREILVIEYDHRISTAAFAIHKNQIRYANKLSLWQRLKYSCQILFLKKPCNNEIILDKNQLKDLRKFLNTLDF